MAHRDAGDGPNIAGPELPDDADLMPLEESLQRLRAEIQALDIGNEAARQRLERLVAEIEQTLADPAERQAGSLGDQLKDSVLSFEASHPRLAGVMNEVVEKLSAMGI